MDAYGRVGVLDEFSPGRHFASNELKAILGHIILNYDLKLGGDGSRPPAIHFATAVVLPQGGRIIFRKHGGSGST